ncbi:DNA-binding bromodomain-containing protein [Arabidopsis thaliana]|uniref:DNA-binding bromodomain-containing protein n=1 Tax=Arabidopsis thaliana TaxID=3702 RepID=Q8GZ14_ARATH|nr:DNA-binding bromodomain-containing protein [Arabidopsis thaliana]AEE35830.1 DNA-binding bromodomain-containing protein [Arabidopsis thaliana]BAC41941.1 unknown protein [Arabidopsis thaliana]|eukprot:NP_177764.2 DNA-binding bromodomain-containing protein [Arabidopsis thaliana]
MGEVADNNTLMKRKKKGRPSLLDLQKRALKQQQLLQRRNPNEENEEELRSSSRNPNFSNRSNRRRNSNSEDDDDERRDKKHRLLHGLNSHEGRDSSNSKSGGGDLDSDARNRRKIDGSDNTGEKASKATDILLQRSLVESTPLPDKKLLFFILDRVQKKDTYGVYSDPADPEELPDYYEIIKNPMDFTTLRKKLESGAYTTLEQFEQDVFLICTNAMEYNSADTVYYRQARAMLELAKKDFGNLRQESDGEEPVSLSQQPKVVKRGRPPGSGLKKQLEQSLIDRTTSDISADAAAFTYAGDSSRLSGSYNLRKNPPSYGFRHAETSVRINHNSENQSGLLIDWEKEFPPSVVKAVNKYGMKNVDENRRDTYNQNSASLQDSSIFTLLDDNLKQLTPVGLKAEYGYARSLARYAANIGPVAWTFANVRIEKLLPTGTEFGPGWVGENPENPPQQQNLMSGKQKCSNDYASDDHHQSSRIMSPSTSVSSSIIGNIHSSHESKESVQVLNQETEINGLVRGSSGFNHKPNQMLETAGSQQGNIKQEFQRLPPDLNARLSSPNSPGSNHQAGSSQHPDLALQL